MSTFVVVSQDFPPDVGGTQTYALEVASRLAKNHHVVVVAPERPGPPLPSVPFRVERAGRNLNTFPLRATPLLQSLLADEPAGVLCIQWNSALAVRIAATAAGYQGPVGLAAHGRELLFNPRGGRFGGHAYDGLRRWALGRVDQFFAVSRYTAGLLEERGLGPVSVVPNGVDASRFDPALRAESRNRLKVNGPMILCVCRLVERKGVDVLIQAFRRLLPDHPAAVLWIVGDGPAKQALEDEAEDLGLSVRFTGRVKYENLPLVFQAADVFAMVPRHAPPDVEGFGLVYLEASACAVPCVASRAGGIEDAVLDGETGLIVPPGDVDATESALRRLLGDRDLAAALGQQGRQHATVSASWDRVADTIRSQLLARD